MSTRVEIKFSELPEWAQAQAISYLGERKAPHAYTNVDVCEDNLSIAGVTDEYSARIVVGRNSAGEIRRVESGYYESLINASRHEQGAYLGGTVEGVGPDDAILTVQKGPHINTATLYVMKGGCYEHLADNQASNEGLPEWVKAVLRFYAGLNSRGRKDALWRYNIPKQMTLDALPMLQEAGFVKVNKAGAVTVTVEGRQASKDRFAQSIYSTDWAALAAEWRASK
jgi:hypothetical protein